MFNTDYFINIHKSQPGLGWVGGSWSFKFNLLFNCFKFSLWSFIFMLIFANFKISFTRKNWLLKFGFAYRLAQILEPKLLVHEILKFARVFSRMWHDSAIACTLNVRGVFTSTSSRNCEQRRDLKRGIRERLCFASSQLQADRNSSPLVSL